MKCAECPYFWKDEDSKNGCCHYRWNDGYAPCEVDETEAYYEEVEE